MAFCKYCDGPVSIVGRPCEDCQRQLDGERAKKSRSQPGSLDCQYCGGPAPALGTPCENCRPPAANSGSWIEEFDRGSEYYRPEALEELKGKRFRVLKESWPYDTSWFDSSAPITVTEILLTPDLGEAVQAADRSADLQAWPDRLERVLVGVEGTIEMAPGNGNVSGYFYCAPTEPFVPDGIPLGGPFNPALDARPASDLGLPGDLHWARLDRVAYVVDRAHQAWNQEVLEIPPREDHLLQAKIYRGLEKGGLKQLTDQFDLGNLCHLNVAIDSDGISRIPAAIVQLVENLASFGVQSVDFGLNCFCGVCKSEFRRSNGLKAGQSHGCHRTWKRELLIATDYGFDFETLDEVPVDFCLADLSQGRQVRPNPPSAQVIQSLDLDHSRWKKVQLDPRADWD